MHASFAFATDMFDPETIETLSARFLRVLDAVLEDPSTVVADIDLLSEEERRQLSGVWGGDGVEPRTLAEILAAAAHTDPTRTALTYEGRQLSYRALDEDSNRLARLLVSRGSARNRWWRCRCPAPSSRWRRVGGRQDRCRVRTG
ncbi:hypothetical protein GS926_27515, partial [Rhodococcus hoagii]|nr:hypothetical protein [Prescottella equi]